MGGSARKVSMRIQRQWSHVPMCEHGNCHYRVAVLVVAILLDIVAEPVRG